MSTDDQTNRELAKRVTEVVQSLSKAEALLNSPGRFDADRKEKAAWEVSKAYKSMRLIKGLVEDQS